MPEAETTPAEVLATDMPSDGKPTAPTDGKVKLTMNLPRQDAEALKELADHYDITLTQAIRRAIAIEQFLAEMEEEGSKILIEKKDKTLRELLVR